MAALKTFHSARVGGAQETFFFISKWPLAIGSQFLFFRHLGQTSFGTGIKFDLFKNFGDRKNDPGTEARHQAHLGCDGLLRDLERLLFAH